MAYTPYLTEMGKGLGKALGQQGQNELIQSAYMGEPGAMAQLTAVNPQAAQKIQKDKVSEKQTALQAQDRERGIEADKVKAQEALAKVKGPIMEQVAKLPFDQAVAYLEQKKGEHSGLISAAGVDPASIVISKEQHGQLVQQSKPKPAGEFADVPGLPGYKGQPVEDTGEYKNIKKVGIDGAGGDVELKRFADGFFHKVSSDGVDLGKLTDAEGKESEKFWAAEKELSVGERAKNAEETRRKKLGLQENKALVKQTTDLRKEYDDDISSLKEMDELIDTVLVGLETGGGLGDKIVKSSLSRLGNSKVRALAELNEYKSYGTVIERSAGVVSGFLSGEKTDEQKKQALETVLSFREKFVRPGLGAAKNYYRTLAKKGKLDIHSVAKFKDRNDVKQAFDKGLLTEDEAYEVIKAIE